jgi:hypothetical protein
MRSSSYNHNDAYNTDIYDINKIIQMVLNDSRYIQEFFMGFNSVICILFAIGICYIMRDYSKIITYDTLTKIENFILCKRNIVEGFEDYVDIEAQL